MRPTVCVCVSISGIHLFRLYVSMLKMSKVVKCRALHYTIKKKRYNMIKIRPPTTVVGLSWIR